MNRKTCMKHAKRLALGLAALAIAATPSFAQTSYDLCASDGTVTMPDSTVVPIWGYADITGGGPCAPGMATLPGPELRATAGETLTINLTNALTVPVSIFIPGYRATTTGGSAGMFTAEAAPVVGTVTYELIARAGTYLYHSGTNIRTQVPMGLYGALVVDFAAGQAYSDVIYGEDQVVLYSEIDPNLNADPANFGGARVINWIPQYYMINGVAQPATSDVIIGADADVLLRFVNAGIQTYTPTLDGGLYLDLKAEDGNRYPQPLQQYGIELPAGKTIDAMVSAPEGSYALYDRGASYDSGVTAIIAGAILGAPTAVDDAYPAVEDTPLVVLAIDGVLFNDSTDATAAVLVTGPSAGTLVGGLASGGGFTYQPNANFWGDDTFTYKANDGAGGPNSNVATVTITVSPLNDDPVAVADAYNAITGQTLSVASPGVLWNDIDVDGDGLTAVLFSAPPVGSTLVLNSNGSFDYTPAGAAGAIETFQYVANDGTVDSLPATVTIMVDPVPDNIAPFANDDFAEALKNSAGITIDVTANDVDADGDIDPTTVVLTTGPNTQRAGTVSVDPVTGVVTYVPKRGFRGTDTFKYTVDDNDAETSNEATVRVNVS